MSGVRVTKARTWYWIGRYLLFVFGIALLVLGLLLLLRLGIFYSLYTWLLAQVVENTGLDVWPSRAITLGLLAAIWYFAGHLLVFSWFPGRRKRVSILMAATALGLAGMELATRNVYFSRADGTPAKYYILTLDGYKLSATPGTDPVYGIRYRPMTTDVAREYLLWNRRGGKLQDPAVPEYQYFDSSTGDPVRWYAKLSDGRIELFTLPGFHPKFGTKLLPVTPQVIAQYEQQDLAPPDGFLPGRYLFAEPRRMAIVGDLCFTLTEVDLIGEKLLVHLEVESLNVGEDRRVEEVPNVKFGLVTEEGSFVPGAICRAGIGSLLSWDGPMIFGSTGSIGWLQVEFPALAGPWMSFSLTADDNAVFGSVDLREVDYRSF